MDEYVNVLVLSWFKVKFKGEPEGKRRETEDDGTISLDRGTWNGLDIM